MPRNDAGAESNGQDRSGTVPSGRSRIRLPFNVALVLPAQLTILAVVLVPALILIWLSFTDWQPTSGLPWYDAEPIGTWNFRDLWHDERFLGSIMRTLLIVGVAVTVELVIAVGLALLFLDEWSWRKLAVSAVLLPMMIIPVDAANAFFMMFSSTGPVNHLISLLTGRDFQFSWLSDPDWAIVPIMLAEIWQWTPLMFLLVLTGLMNLPQNQIRAAVSLGASRTRIIRMIMLPLALPVIAVAVTVRGIEIFKLFDPIYIMTRGGPGTSTESISMYLYNTAFVYFRIGYSAAAALVVLVITIFIILALARPLKEHHG